MKNYTHPLGALLCAALISTSPVTSHASDIPLPEHKPAYTSASMDQASLAEARHLLQKLSLELKSEPSPAPTARIQKASFSPPTKQEAIKAIEREEIRSEDLSISKIGDMNLSCGALSVEAANMRDIIFTTQDIKDSTNMKSHGVTAAGAIGSFLIGTVTGGVGLAVGGFLLDHNLNRTENEADAIQDTAAQRRTLMMGIYGAKGCEGPLEHAMQNPDIFDPLGNLASIETASGTSEAPDYNQ